jgi:diketogulonate reductase-like aldo/keto reductase
LSSFFINTAYSPLATGRILDDERLARVAEKYNRSVAQICIRWSLQKGFLPLPKSKTPSRIKENLEVFDFEISQEDMLLIEKK